jgi:hypothetical protein
VSRRPGLRKFPDIPVPESGVPVAVPDPPSVPEAFFRKPVFMICCLAEMPFREDFPAGVIA